MKNRFCDRFQCCNMFVLKRSHHNPILKPVKEHPWEAHAVFNWAPVFEKETGLTHCLYRAMTNPDVMGGPTFSLSTIGYTVSTDSVHFDQRRQFIVPEYEWERFGCEDPKITKLGDKYYIFYTGLSTYPFTPSGIKVALAITKDFKVIDRKELITPFNSKAMALFPEKIDGKFAALLTVDPDLPPAKIGLAFFEKEEDMWSLEYWNRWYSSLSQHVLPIQRNSSNRIELGSAPLKTDQGWIVLYGVIQHHESENRTFGVEAVLLDLQDPSKIIGRTSSPFLVPEENYEKYGYLNDVIWPSSAIIIDDLLKVYYGATDMNCCRASIRVSDLLRAMTREGREEVVRRFEKNPLLLPSPKNAWEERAVFNPAAVDSGGRIHVVYRAMSLDNTSVMGYMSSKDGYDFDQKTEEPIYGPTQPFEEKRVPNGNSGCEDPRITKIENRFYMCYTAYNGVEVPRVAITSISEEDFVKNNWRWTKPIIFSPYDIDDKDTCLFPEKINGQYMVLHRVASHICGDTLNSLDFEKERITKCIQLIGPRPGMWDSKKVGIAGPPMKTEKGWLLLYHGVSDDSVYRVGAALLDLENPANVLARTSDFLLEPEEEWEKEGQIQNVVFPCGAVIREDTIFVYYGGADSVVAGATISLSELLRILS